jgi:hypothetical protein
MSGRIREHCILNGVAFVVCEFSLVVGGAVFIAVALGLHHVWIGVFLAIGVLLNSLVVVAIGVAMWKRGERGTSVHNVFDAKYRAELSRSHPAMMKDTIILATSTLAPYFLMASIVCEQIRTR